VQAEFSGQHQADRPGSDHYDVIGFHHQASALWQWLAVVKLPSAMFDGNAQECARRPGVQLWIEPA
jgi:hypothetical protein